MKLKLITVASGLLVSSLTLADTYQTDLRASVSRYDNNYYSSDTNDYMLEGAYYFDAVKTTNLPLAEAAYLNKSSNVFASVYDRPEQHHNRSLQSFALGAEVYIPENFLYVKAGVVRRSSNYSDRDDWFTAVGVTPIDGLLLTTEYFHDAGYDANIHAKYVTDIGSGQFINLEAAYTDADSGSQIELGGDFYFDNTFSVGALVSDYDWGTDYTVRTRKFFTESFSADLAYTDAEQGNIVTLGANLRF